MTAGDTPPSVAAITVARLDRSSGWRRFAVRADGPAWVALDRRLADGAALDAWVESELRATAGGHRDLAGALIVYRLAGHLAELTVGCLVDQRRALALTPAAVALRFGDAARLDEMAVSTPTVAVLPDDPVAGDPGTEVVASVDALRAVAADGWSRHSDPSPTPCGPGRRSACGGCGAPSPITSPRSPCAEPASRAGTWRRRGPSRRGCWTSWPPRVPLPWTRPRRQVVPTATGPQAVVTKGTCCLIYKASVPPGDRGAAARLIAPAACTSCPLRPEDDRARRFSAYLESQWS